MIYITGDTHGSFDGFIGRFNNQPNSDDIVIVCGDFGFIFSEMQKPDFERLKELPYTILFVDGNHENYSEIYSYPIEEWCGGKIHRIAPNIAHLMRGQLFLIYGKTFFTMGGAYSVDRGWRVRDASWWEQELPNDEEYCTASETLAMSNYKVDYILSHDAPDSVIMRMGLSPNPRGAELTGFLEWVFRKVEFRKWFFGHYHSDLMFDDKSYCMYNGIFML